MNSEKDSVGLPAALPFHRTRNDHRRETAEDYVELVFRLEPAPGVGVRNADLVAVLGVAQPTVTKTLERLQAEGLVSAPARGRVLLTDEGRALAASAHERHRLVVDFLVCIGVPAHHAEIDAEGIEHHVSEVTLTAMRAFLRGTRHEIS